MYSAAPRVERDLLEAISRLDDRSTPMAETYRRCRELAEQRGVPRPSYERVRQHLKALRRSRARRQIKRDILLDVALGLRPVEDLYELLE